MTPLDPTQMSNAELLENGRRNIERRSSDRDLNSPLVCEFRRVRAESESRAFVILRQAERIDELVMQNRQLREAVAKAARKIELGMRGPSRSAVGQAKRESHDEVQRVIDVDGPHQPKGDPHATN